MKLFYLLTGSILALMGCTKPADKPPTNNPNNNSAFTIVMTPQDTTVHDGDSINFTIVASSTNSLASAAFTQSINGGVATQVGSPIVLADLKDQFKIKYYVPKGSSGKIKFTCTVTDSKGKTDTASANINNNTNPNAPIIVVSNPGKDTTVSASYNFTVKIHVTAINSSKIDSIVRTDGSGPEVKRVVKGLKTGNVSYTTDTLIYDFFQIPSSATGTTFKLKYTVYDNKGNQDSAIRKINVH
ncbi:MAG: hypothetical protein ACHQF4_11745 [Sphingobacteriales bacterium]